MYRIRSRKRASNPGEVDRSQGRRSDCGVVGGLTKLISLYICTGNELRLSAAGISFGLDERRLWSAGAMGFRVREASDDRGFRE